MQSPTLPSTFTTPAATDRQATRNAGPAGARITGLLAVTAFLAGCASPYIPNLEGRPVARMRFVTEHPGPTRGLGSTFVHQHPDGCAPDPDAWLHASRSTTIAVLTGRASLGTPIQELLPQPKEAMVRLGMPGETPSNPGLFAERRIPADEPFVFSMSGAHAAGYNRYASCTVAAAFRPEPGGDYQATFGLAGGQICTLQVFRVRGPGRVGDADLVRISRAPRC